MNAPTTFPAPSSPEAAPEAPLVRTRIDGWTPDRRVTFLAALADGHTVEAACRHVALSPASAYALRRRDDLFAIGWNGACLRAREALADMLMSRAIDGQVDTYTRADGQQVTRHRYDNRLGQAMLARLDRLAEVPPAGTAQAVDAGLARAAACGFGDFLALVEDEADGDALNEFFDALAPRTSQLPQLSDGDSDSDEEDEADEDEQAAPAEPDPVWFEDEDRIWYTDLRPPRNFRGEEQGTFGTLEYKRTLTRAETVVAERRYAADLAAERDEEEARYARWLGAEAGGQGAEAEAL